MHGLVRLEPWQTPFFAPKRTTERSLKDYCNAVSFLFFILLLRQDDCLPAVLTDLTPKPRLPLEVKLQNQMFIGGEKRCVVCDFVVLYCPACSFHHIDVRFWRGPASNSSSGQPQVASVGELRSCCCCLHTTLALGDKPG